MLEFGLGLLLLRVSAAHATPPRGDLPARALPDGREEAISLEIILGGRHRMPLVTEGEDRPVAGRPHVVMDVMLDKADAAAEVLWPRPCPRVEKLCRGAWLDRTARLAGNGGGREVSLTVAASFRLNTKLKMLNWLQTEDAVTKAGGNYKPPYGYR